MERMPNCLYLTQTKSPDANEGNAEYHCSTFDWTEATFTALDGFGERIGLSTLYRNESLFDQCLNCPHNHSGEL